jgi:hypothetical protein
MAGMRFILTAMAAGRNGVKSKALVWRAMHLWLSGYQENRGSWLSSKSGMDWPAETLSEGIRRSQFRQAG